MPHGVTPASAIRQQSDLLLNIARIRWAAIALSLAMVWLTDSAPLLPGVLVGLTILMAVYNIPLMFARRISGRRMRNLAIVSLVGDFIVCTAWVALTAGDPTATNYVVYMVVAVEAAVLFRWRGTLLFIAAFVACLALVYLDKALAFHEPTQVGSVIFRFGIVIVMATISGSVSSASESRRANAEAAALDAIKESDRLETVHRLARGLGSSLRRDDVLSAAAGALAVIFPRRWSGVLLDDGAGMVRLAAGNGEPAELSIPIPEDSSLFSAQETLVFEDFWASSYLELLGVVPPNSLRDYATAAVVPLHSGERLLGALVAMGRPGEGFETEDVRVLEAITPQISMALENARLYEETESLALADPLTRLGNRRAFDQRLEHEIERAQRHGHAMSLVLLDIDHFKVYNDTHGHPAGDDILRRLGDALSNRLLRRTDVAFRYGGEEFAVIMPETTAGEANAVMQRVHEMLASEPMPRGDHQPGGYLTISAGISSCEGHGCASAHIIEQADLALFGAKQSGRNRTLVYDSELAASLTNWTTVLPTILDDRALYAVYQPIVRLDNRATVAFEALARPTGREAGTNVEGMFAAAQRTGLLHDLDWLCFRTAVQDAGALPSGNDLFINITLAALLDSSRDPEYLDLVLRWARRPATDIVLEISEREAVTDLPRLAGVLAAYRALGFRFALDDVGEGHSTFELLAAAEPEFVKIARSLVVNARGAGSMGTIRALVEFARATGAQVVAEGISDEDSARLMRDLGVELGQGYGLRRPAALPAGGLDERGQTHSHLAVDVGRSL